MVGFLVGFAVVAGFRLVQPDAQGAQLTSAQVLHRGAAVDHVADQPCERDRRPVLVLT